MKRIPQAGKPRFQHDCDRCVFLGAFSEENHNCDLYFCSQGGLGPTLLARYSDKGPDYVSGWNVGQNAAERKLVRNLGDGELHEYVNPPMKAAFLRAVEAQLASPTSEPLQPKGLPVPSNLEDIV